MCAHGWLVAALANSRNSLSPSVAGIYAEDFRNEIGGTGTGTGMGVGYYAIEYNMQLSLGTKTSLSSGWMSQTLIANLQMTLSPSPSPFPFRSSCSLSLLFDSLKLSNFHIKATPARSCGVYQWFSSPHTPRHSLARSHPLSSRRGINSQKFASRGVEKNLISTLFDNWM